MNDIRYRERMYSSYLGHLSSRNVSRESLEEQRKVYRHYYGAFLPSDKNARVLEIGCGYGAFLYFLQREGYVNVSGIDRSSDSIGLARTFGMESVDVADAFSFLKDRREEFDAVFALDVLEHLTKDEILELVDSVHRSLRKGGRFVVQVPNAGAVFASFYRYSDFTHEISFTPLTIRDIFRTCTFDDIVVTPTAPMVGGIRSFFRYLLWKAVNRVLRFYLLRVEGLGPYDYAASVNLIASGRKP